MRFYFAIYGIYGEKISVRDWNTNQGLLDISQIGLRLWNGMDKRYYDINNLNKLILDGVDDI
jgi:hypothetical protein